jgi:gliding motility-associated-like protein
MRLKLAVVFTLFLSIISFGQNFGSFASGIKVQNTIYNLTASAPIHQINPNSGAQQFDGVNLGTFGQNSTCATITGAEVKTWKNATGNVCGVTLNWRVYAASVAPSGSFNAINLTNVSDCDLGTNIFNDGLGPCGSGDQKWKNYAVNTNFLNSLSIGNYILEVYYSYTGSDLSSGTCETTKYISNSGNNYKASFTITNPTCSPTVSPTTICEGDSLTLTSNPANGVAPYTYSWTGPNGYTSSISNPIISNATLANAGVYNLVVTDFCGTSSIMQSTSSVVVNEKIIPTFDAILPAICRNGTPPVLSNTSSNFINGTWFPAIVSNTATGTYLFTPDPGQCATTYSLTIFVVNNVNPTFTLPAAICYGSPAPILSPTSNNGIPGFWTPSVVSNTTTGTYLFTPVGGQCANPKTVIITVTPNVQATFTLPSFVCENGSVPLLPTTSDNGITGTWSPSVVSNTTTGTYIFVHTPGLCAINFGITITVNPNLTPTFDPIAPICSGATAPILPPTSTNGVTGNWSPATVSNTANGTYTFLPNTNQCVTNTVVTLDVVVNPNIDPLFTLPSFVCQNGAVPTLPTTSDNGITGTWSPAIVSNTTSNTYTFTPTNGLCATSLAVNITVNPNLTPTFDSISPICSGATAPILPPTSTNGVSGTWTPPIVSNTASGTYTFLPSANQCVTNTVVTLNVVVNPNITPTFSLPNFVCENGTVPTLSTTSNNGISGTWSPAIVSNVTSGSYVFTPTNGLCAVSITKNITVRPNITPTFDPIAPICSGATAPILPLTSLNGISGTWSPATVSNTVTGTYTFLPNSNQCVTNSEVIITVFVIPTFPIFDAVSPICAGAVLTALPTTSNNGVTGSWTPALDNTITTQYTFTPDSGQCATALYLLTIVVNPILTPTFNPVAPICTGASLVALPTTSNNGIIGSWSPALNNTATTTYTFTPSTGQCGVPTTLEIVVNQLIPTFNDVPPICSGDTLSALPTTSTNGINGSWSPSLNNTATTTYTFVPASGQCSTTNYSLTIVVNQKTLPLFDQVSPICQGSVLANLPTTSNNSITGTWSPAMNNATTTTYTFLPSTGQCALNTSMIIVVNPLIATFNPVSPICAGASLSALPTTSNNGITGTWSPALDNTATTLYTFTPNSGQCATEQVSLTITVNPIVTPTFDTVSPICVGASLSSLPTTSNNGITGTWLPALNNTATTLYTFTPNNPLQCGLTTTLTITVNPIVTPIFDAVLPICEGSFLANLPTTSNNSITGTWSPAMNNLATTIYTFTPNDPSQCAFNATMIIVVNPLVATFNAVSPICAGASLSALSTTSNNGITGTWSPALDNTATTLYTFTPSSGQCATEQVSLTITVNPIVTPTFTQVAPICSGGAFSLPTTSIEGITGTWLPAIDNTSTTNYIFTPNNASQCAVTANMTVVVNPTVATFTQVAPICAGDTLLALPTTSNNGVTGSWSPALDNTTTTTYNFLPDAGQCAIALYPMTIIVNPIVTPTFNQVAPICNGDVLNALPTTSINSITGTWSPAVNNTVTTLYTFTPSGGLCVVPTTMTIVVNPIVTPTFTQVAPICNGGAFSLPTTSIEGITGTWLPAIDNTSTTNYIFTPNNALQCSVTANMTVVVNPTVATFTQVAPICAGDTLLALPTTSSNGVTGSWSPALDNTTTTTYNFLPDAGQCATALYPMTIIVNPIVTPIFSFGNSSVCQNPSIQPLIPSTSNNGIVGTWSPNTIDFSVLGNTIYTFTSNIGQCASNTFFTVTVNPIVTPTFTQVAPICNGGAFSLPTTSTEGITGTWLPAINNTSTTNYIFTPNNASQCAVTANMTVVVNPTVATFTQVAPICAGDTLLALPTTSSNGVTGSWSPALDNTTTTTYNFLPDAGQCAIALYPMTIIVNPIVTPTFNQVAPICAGGTLPALPTSSVNSITGTWSPALNNTVTTLYTFHPNNITQCAIQTTMTIVVNPNITPTFTPISPVCSGTTSPILPLISLEGISGTWLPSVISNTISGTYNFTPTSGICPLPTSINIVVIEPLFVEFVGGCNNGSYELKVNPSNNSYNANTATYVWRDELGNIIGTNSPLINVTNAMSASSQVEHDPLTYSVTVTTPEGCLLTKSFTMDGTYCEIQKGISPNNDGLNEFFDLSQLDVKQLEIFNRYGTKVYSKSNYKKEWFGQTDAGDELPDGTYYYVIEFNSSVTKTGWIFINR